MESYLNELNDNQIAAVTYLDGPSLVLAGAGSGKTRVLTYKIAYLLDQKYSPSSILALTFTNKAAREMKERIGKLAGEKNSRYLWMGTFHSIFSRILRAECKALGFTSTFTIYDSADSKSLIRVILKEHKCDEKQYKLSSIQARISMAKNNLITATTYRNNTDLLTHDKACQIPLMADIYRIYSERCKKANAMDFDDLLLYTNILFRDFPDVLEKYRELFRFILVDEYQDTNIAQYYIIKSLALKHQKLCVVGDDAQSIYSFRGAKVENILKFPKDFDNCKVFKLEQNYRSTQNIVNAANSLINKNKEQFAKNNFSTNDAGDKIEVLASYSDMEEGFLVSSKITEFYIRDHIQYQDFAILYRTNAQSRVMEDAFRKRGIPYKIYGGLSFYQRKEIKDILSYFRLILNKNDDEALRRIINYPARGIGESTLDKIALKAVELNVSMFDVCEKPDTFALNVNTGTARKLLAFSELITNFASEIDKLPAFEFATKVAKQSGMLEQLEGDSKLESISRVQNIDELLNAIKDFSDSRKESELPEGLNYFLEDVSLLTDQDAETDDDKNKVTLMTIHASKGLEFDTVFVVGVEEGLFPSERSNENPKELEEERRLFYVAITRAKVRCIISYAKSRYKYGEPKFTKPSRFIRDIDPNLLLLSSDPLLAASLKAAGVKTSSSASIKSNFRSLKSQQEARTAPSIYSKVTKPVEQRPVDTDQPAISSDPRGIKPGMVVEHLRFGVGTIESIMGMGDNIKAQINFDSVGSKTLLLRFARLKIINQN